MAKSFLRILGDVLGLTSPSSARKSTRSSAKSKRKSTVKKSARVAKKAVKAKPAKGGSSTGRKKSSKRR